MGFTPHRQPPPDALPQGLGPWPSINSPRRRLGPGFFYRRIGRTAGRYVKSYDAWHLPGVWARAPSTFFEGNLADRIAPPFAEDWSHISRPGRSRHGWVERIALGRRRHRADRAQLRIGHYWSIRGASKRRKRRHKAPPVIDQYWPITFRALRRRRRVLRVRAAGCGLRAAGCGAENVGGREAMFGQDRRIDRRRRGIGEREPRRRLLQLPKAASPPQLTAYVETNSGSGKLDIKAP